jgi:hypothetical protein
VGVLGRVMVISPLPDASLSAGYEILPLSH